VTNKKFGLFFVALVALILSACGATGYPVGNVQMLDDGKTAVIQPGSYFCLKSDLKDIGAPLKGLTIAAGTAVMAPSEVVTISLEIGDINGKYSTGLCDPATGQMRTAAPKPSDVPKIAATAQPTVVATVAPTDVPKIAATAQLTPTAVPTAMSQPTVTVPAAGQFNPTLGLKYVHPMAPANGSCVGLADWDQYPACILQRVQNQELTGPNAVVMIQKLGAAKGAPSFEGTTLSVPDGQAMFVWCPSGATLPSDVAQPLRGTRGAQWGENVFIAAVSSQRTIMSKTGDNCWGVFVQ